MSKGFMYQNGVLKCNLILEFKDTTILKERVSTLREEILAGRKFGGI